MTKFPEQRFEFHSDLAAHIERMANTGQTGSVIEWSRFLEKLNQALRDEYIAGRSA